MLAGHSVSMTEGSNEEATDSMGTACQTGEVQAKGIRVGDRYADGSRLLVLESVRPHQIDQMVVISEVSEEGAPSFEMGFEHPDVPQQAFL